MSVHMHAFQPVRSVGEAAGSYAAASPAVVGDPVDHADHADHADRADRADHAGGATAPVELPRLRSGLPAAQVHAELRRCLAAMHRAEQSAFLWFAELVQRRLYRELGYASVQAYASEELGLTQNRVNRYLRLMQDLDRLPQIRAALHAGTIGWTKARAIVRVSGPATEGRWLAAARRLSRRELEARVVQARMQAAARRRGNPAQPELVATGSTVGGAPSEQAAGARSSEQAAAGSGRARPYEQVGSTGLAPRPQDILTVSAQDPGGRHPGDAATSLCPTDADPEPLPDEGPVAVVLRFSPIELARFEAQMEKIRKQGRSAVGASREQILLDALDALISEPAGRRTGEVGAEAEAEPACKRMGEVGAEAEAEPACKRMGDARGGAQTQSAGAAECEPECDRGAVPRGTAATPYQIIIYKCEVCHAAVVQTQQGPRRVGRAQLEAVECDAAVSEPGRRNRAAIPPAMRRTVLSRDRHRCRGVGCRNTRFLEVHHIVPRGRGGKNRPENLVTLCSRCHGLWHEKQLDVRMLRPVPE
jgi:hypothetical protein